MIKLNNKNITYVALADTNNSLKAPKEIWYADSNNSVKLVYQRKDALIEGEDYEKYHWLVGDADAYINTLKNYRPYDDSVQMTFRDNLYPNRESKYNKYNQEEQIWGACETNNLQSILIRSYVSGGSAPNSFCNNIIDGNTADSAVSWGIYATQNYINESPEHSLYISSVNNEDRYYFIYNGNTKNNLPTRYTLPELVQQDVRIFYSGIHDNGYFNGSFFNFIHYRNNVEITHLIPCKLLKPVPKWLDANGIRRNVGECGMIDLVSGKFYGNVNNVGTFSVENYYERKEWLVGDGTAYIKGIDYNLWANRVELKVGKINVTTIKNNELHYKPTNDNGNVWAVQQNPTITPQFICIFRESGVSVHIVSIDLMPSQATLSFYQNGGYAYCLYNDTENKGGTLNQSSWDTNIIPTIFSYKMSYIREVLPNGSYRSNLIPCTLTMDLPASMDANNIARTKGTSGMWDLVSDRFYGNVASSGTFKAVNLAEGVDYEVHDILKTLAENTSSAPYDVAYFRFPNYISLIGKVLTLKLGNVYRDYNLGGDIVNNARYYILIYRAGLITTIQERLGNTVLNSVSNSSSTVEIDFDNNVVSVGTSTMNIQGTGYYTFGENNVSWGTEKYLKGLTISDVLNLIPVKLLRSIPSKYDANGITRQAGECGMYDTVNDVFYGNVASSGTFSVSDDS